MRKLLLAAGTLLLLVATANAQEVLQTSSFRVTVMGCKEGEVSCDDARYTGVSKKTGRVLKLKGRTLHTMGADGVTPARFLGWEFRNGGTSYTVTEEGLLEVRQGKKILVSEQGRWESR